MIKHTTVIRNSLNIRPDFAPIGMTDVSKCLDAIDAERTEMLAVLERVARIARAEFGDKRPDLFEQVDAIIAKAKE